jgi:hypothetical protein
MTVSKWMSSLNATGEFSDRSIGKGAVELEPALGNASVKGAETGVGWHTLLFAQLPIAAPEPL